MTPPPGQRSEAGSDDERAALPPLQRFIWAATRSVNEHDRLKRLAHAMLRSGGAAWVNLCTRRLIHVTGREFLDALPLHQRGVVVASNHRSFFDLYVVSSFLLRHITEIRRMYFPVRSDYFYERLDGLVINGIMAAFAMYPPIFRSPAHRYLNRRAVEFLSSQLRRPGTLVGLHPEGRRSTGGDPYTLLPAHPGIGEIVHRSNAVVLPVFVLGLSNDLYRQIRGNFAGTGDPITVTIGSPLRFDEYQGTQPRARVSLDIAERIRVAITALGAREWHIRAALRQPPEGSASGACR